jgi:hypothetical protein
LPNHGHGEGNEIILPSIAALRTELFGDFIEVRFRSGWGVLDARHDELEVFVESLWSHDGSTMKAFSKNLSNGPRMLRQMED